MNQVSTIDFVRPVSGRLSRSARDELFQLRLRLILDMAAGGECREAILASANTFPLQPLNLVDIGVLLRLGPALVRPSTAVFVVPNIIPQAAAPRRALNPVLAKTVVAAEVAPEVSVPEPAPEVSRASLPPSLDAGANMKLMTVMSPSAVVSLERSKAIERLASVRVLGPARTCQTVVDPGRFGIGVRFCGVASVVNKSYCVDCCKRYFVKSGYGWYSDRAMKDAARVR